MTRCQYTCCEEHQVPCINDATEDSLYCGPHTFVASARMHAAGVRSFSPGEIYEAVIKERARQNAKYGAPRKLDATQWFTILGEEVGEIARAVLERDPANLEEEVIQVAAVCFAMLEQWDLMMEASNWYAKAEDPAPNEPEPGNCELCGTPMPPGESMFRYHGFSGSCPA